jgi:glutaminase
MAVTSLIKGETPEERYERAHRMLKSFAGGKLTVDEKVFASEMATDTTNRALAYRLKSKGLFSEDVTETVSATPGPAPSR